MKHAAAPRRGTPRGTTAARAVPVDDRRSARGFFRKIPQQKMLHVLASHELTV
jgi:hypothetical protein